VTVSMSSKVKRKIPGFPYHLDHATSERFMSVEKHAKRLEQRDIQRQEMWVGVSFTQRKGEGKTVGVVQRLADLLNKPDDKYTPKVAKITDEEIREAFRATEEYNKKKELETQNLITTGNTTPISTPISATHFPEINTFAQASGGGGGASGSYNINYQPQPQTNKQSSSGWWDNQQAPWQYQWDTVPNTNTYPPTSIQQTPQKEEPKKQVFKPEDYKGKFCAIVTLTHHGVEHHGVLFVKKCGHWGLRGFNGSKLSGGGSGSFEAELKKGTLKITVHQTIYTDAPEPEIGEDELEIH
jgi:hypothetical protein